VGSTPRLVWYFLLSPPITTVFGWQQLFRNACKFCDYYYHYYKYLLHINSRAPLSLHPLMRLCHHISIQHAYTCVQWNSSTFPPFPFYLFFLRSADSHANHRRKFRKTEKFHFLKFYFHDFRDQVIFNYVYR
jgi:hypothetical protein